MKREITALDIYFLLNEVDLSGGRIDKIYHEGEKTIRIRVYKTGEGEVEIIFKPGIFYISKYKRKAEREPTNFAMLLRKHLLGKRILWMKQKDFERIIELETQDNILIFEPFSKGNVILCDKDYMIIRPLEIQLMKDREILPKRKYEYPPANINPFSLSFEEFKEKIKGNKKIVTVLAALSLGGVYAEEVCHRAGVDKNKKASELDEAEIEKIYQSLHSLLKEKNPCIVYKDGEPINFAPFDLKVYEGYEKKYFDNFSDVVDEFYTYYETKEIETEETKEEKTLEEKIKAIIERQKEIKKNLIKMEEESRKKAETLFNNLDMVERIFEGLKKARERLSWEEIKEKIEIEDSPEARSIKEIRENEGKIVLHLNGLDIELDFTISPIENAQIYYEKAKKYKSKLSKIDERIEQIKEEMKASKKETKVKREKPVKRKEKKNWFEKFRWSITSEGFLVIAGKDATQNEVIYSKYLEENDIVLHADIHGAALTVLKSKNGEVSPLAIREAGEIAAAYSSAWKLKLGNVDVYWVRPEQVSKTPPSGQYLPKGSFMIYGEKNYLRKTEVKISIGVIIDEEKNEGKVYAGSVLGARANCKYFVTIYPGDIPKIQFGKEVKARLLQKALPEDKEIIKNIPDDEFISVLPGDGGEIMG